LPAKSSPVLPPSAPFQPDFGKPRADSLNPKTVPLEIVMEPNQTLRSVARQYIGSSDLKYAHQIQLLNHELTDPNHIEPRQILPLTERLTAPIQTTISSSDGKRSLP